MTDDIYDPLDEYVNTFQPRFEQVAKDTFAQLAKEAQVDVDANRQTCRLLYDAEKSLGAVKSRIGWTTFLCVILWCCAAIGIFAICKDYGTMSPAIATAVLLSVLAAVILLLSVIHPRLKKLKAERGDLKQTIAQHKEEAWEQMAPLNRLYDWDVLTRMMTETVPRLEFDPYFTEQRLADLRQVYGWDDTFNAVRSVVYSHSGLINGNPFVLCRTRKMEMGTKTYYGHKTIYWTTREYGSDGKMKTIPRPSLPASQPPIPDITRRHGLSMAMWQPPTSRSTARRTGLPVAKGRCHTDGTDESCTTRRAISAKATMP